MLEAVGGTAGLAVQMRAGRQADCKRVLGQVKREVARDYRAWIAAEHRDERWYAEANLEEALAAFERVIHHCVPEPQEIVGAKLNGETLAGLLLDRAAPHHAAFAEDSPNPAARPVFRTIVRETYERVRTNPDYAATLRSYIDEALLTGQDRIETKLDAGQTRTDAKLDAILQAIAANVSAEKHVPLATLREIVASLGERDTPLEPAAVEARLRALADEYLALKARLERLSNDDPEVQALRREAAALLDRGDFPAADARLAAGRGPRPGKRGGA